MMEHQQGCLTYDEVLTRHVGEFGRGQVFMVIMTSLFYVPNVFFFYLLVFCSLDPIRQQLWQCVDASDAACNAVVQASGAGFCDLSPEQWRWTDQGNIAAYFNMVCADKWKVQFLNMCMFIGCLIGAALFGYLNDKHGRKRPLLLATLLCLVSVFASAAAPAFWYMAVVRVIIGIGGAGQNQCVALLNTEIAGRSRRGRASIMSGMFWQAGEFVLVGVGYLLPNWRYLSIIAGASCVAELMIYPFISESARWLLSQGRQEEATAVVARIARLNGTQLPPVQLVAQMPSCTRAASQQAEPLAEAACSPAETAAQNNSNNNSGSRTDITTHEQQLLSSAGNSRQKLQVGINSSSSSTDAEKSSGRPQQPAAASAAAVQSTGSCKPPQGLSDVLHQPKLSRRALVLFFTWFSLYIVSYGVNLGSGALPGSVYMTFTLLTVAELTAQFTTVLVADTAGRHNILSAGLILSGAACLGCASTSVSAARATLAVLGKFGCTIGMAVLGTFTTELFATPIRASAMGVLNEAGRLGSIVAPLMLMVGSQVEPDNPVFVPFLTFGSAAMVAGVLTLLLPETLGASMPEDLNDMNQLTSVFTAAPWKQGIFATVSFLFRARALQVSRQARPQQQQQQQKMKPQGTEVVVVAPEKEKGTANASVLHVHVDCWGRAGPEQGCAGNQRHHVERARADNV